MTSTEIELSNFFIFNSILGAKEGEEEKKILFYHPAKTQNDIKIRDIGLSEAIIKFSNTFSEESDSCKSVHTMKSVQVLHTPEPDFWMVMTIKTPHTKYTREGVEYDEYKGDEICEKIYYAVLERSYKLFRLLNGRFTDLFKGPTIEDKSLALISKFELFFSEYLQKLNLTNCDMVDVFKSIQYLPQDKRLFLQINSINTAISSTFQTVKYALFLYKEKVLWSSINPDDLFSVYQYLTGTLLPSINEDVFPAAISHTQTCSFLVGPPSSERKPIPITIYDDSTKEELQLIIYQAFNVTCCLFINSKIPDDFYSELQTLVNVKLGILSSDIDDFASKMTDGKKEESGPKFLYLCNSRHSGNLRDNQVTRELKNILMDFYNENGTKSEETVVKTTKDCWIIQKSSNSRSFFVVINKYATLIEITEEASKIFDQQVKDIVFFQ